MARARRGRRRRPASAVSGRQPKRGRGRPKGSTNFFTRDMKEAIIDACNELGFDGQGQEGMKGYMKFLGKNFPRCSVG